MSAGTLALILNFVFVFILVVGFLIGLWRGVKKASLNLGITLIGVLVGFFVSGPITKAVLGIKVGGEQTLSQYIINMITQSADIKHLYDTTPSLQQTVAGLPYAIATPIVFLVVSILVMLVTYLIYRIIACFIKKKDKEGNKIKQYRIAGGAVGLAKALILTLFISMPLVSLIGTANDLLNPPTESYVSAATENEQKSEGPLSSLVPKQVSDIVDGLDTSAFGVLGNMFGLDNATFDYLSTFKVNDETIHIRQEVDNVAQVYTAYEVFADTFNSSESKFEEIDFDKIDKSVNALLSSKFFKTVISDVAYNLISDSKSYSFFDGLRQGEFGPILEDVSTYIADFEGSKSDFFSGDIQKIYATFKDLSTCGALDTSFNGENGVIEGLKNLALENGEELQSALQNLFTTNLFKSSAPAVVNLALDKLIDGLDSVEFDAENVDWDSTAANLVDAIKTFGSINVDINEVLTKPESLLSKDNSVDIVELFGNLGKLVDTFNKIDIFKVEGKSVVENLLEENKFTIPTTLASQDEYKPENPERYKNFFTYLGEPLARIKDLDLYSLATAGTVNPNDIVKALSTGLASDKSSPEKENTLEIILIRLNKIPKTKELIVDKLSSSLGTLSESFIDFDLILNSSKWDGKEADWRTELGHIADLFIALNKDAGKDELGNDQTYFDLVLKGVDKFMEKLNSEQEDGLTITEVLKPVLTAKSTATLKTNIFKTFEDAMNKLFDDDVTVDATKATADQTDEICEVFEKFIDLYSVFQGESVQFTELYKDENKTKIDELESALKTNADNHQENAVFKSTYDALKSKLDLIRQAQSHLGG